jgi:hypothetical protein
MFYPENIKVIPENIYDLLTPVALGGSSYQGEMGKHERTGWYYVLIHIQFKMLCD